MVQHQNIISIKEVCYNSSIIDPSSQQNQYVSYILMELGLCDFQAQIQNLGLLNDEKFARTLFKQLFDGVAYIQEFEIAHMDLKLENLLFGRDLKLKIIDFDLSYREGDRECGAGTINYRAPEVRLKKGDLDPLKCDIYSMGIILFVMLTGHLPYSEDTKVQGYDLFKFMREEPAKFWEAHERLFPDQNDFDEKFKKLFLGLVSDDIEERFTLDEIKADEWFNGLVYSDDEYAEIVRAMVRG